MLFRATSTLFQRQPCAAAALEPFSHAIHHVHSTLRGAADRPAAGLSEIIIACPAAELCAPATRPAEKRAHVRQPYQCSVSLHCTKGLSRAAAGASYRMRGPEASMVAFALTGSRPDTTQILHLNLNLFPTAPIALIFPNPYSIIHPWR